MRISIAKATRDMHVFKHHINNQGIFVATNEYYCPSLAVLQLSASVIS
jgi:hypothetical protein